MDSTMMYFHVKKTGNQSVNPVKNLPIVRTYNWILGLQIIFHGAELIEAGAEFRNESF